MKTEPATEPLTAISRMRLINPVALVSLLESLDAAMTVGLIDENDFDHIAEIDAQNYINDMKAFENEDDLAGFSLIDAHDGLPF